MMRRVFTDENGSGTIQTIGALALIVCIAVVGIAVAALHSTKTWVQGVADMSALAGAEYSCLSQWVPQGDKPCEVARDVAARHEMHMEHCSVDGVDTLVIVSRHKTVVGFPVVIRARARAGPEVIP